MSPLERFATAGVPISVPDPSKAGPHNYLLCLDVEDSAASANALLYAKKRLAKDGDLVVLFTRADPPVTFSPAFTSLYPTSLNAEALRKEEFLIKKGAESRLKEAARGFAAGVKVETCVVFGSTGSTVEKIVETAKKFNCEIIIVGRRKRAALQRWLGSGSVSTALLTNTSYSILVVR